MLEKLTKAELNSLVGVNDLCLSFYLPTFKSGPEVQQNSIRLKNLLAVAQSQLEKRGMRKREITELLQPVTDLLPDKDFWNHQSEGLAVLLTPQLFKTFSLPYDVGERFEIGSKFYLRPLFPAINQDGDFYILAISQNELRLLAASRNNVRVMELETVPTSLAEALKYDDPEKQLQLHQSQGGGNAAIFHGHGVGDGKYKKDEVLRYFHLVDDGISEIMAQKEAPLLLAAVDYLHPIYHEANSYPHVFETGIIGNPDNLSPKELHERAWELVLPYLAQERTEAIKSFNELSETDKTCQDIETIVKAAHFGRIDTLLINGDKHQYGIFIPGENEVSLQETSTLQNEELLNRAAADTYNNSGSVYVLGDKEMPNDAALAAVFRYTI